jgi:ferric-dicitrate binding protein FerR (iron transport regulator)
LEPLNEHIYELIADKLSGQISAENDALLTELIRTDEAVRRQWQQSETALAVYRAAQQANSINDDEAWNRLSAKLQPLQEMDERPSTAYRYRWFAAAGLLLPLILGALWFALFRSHQDFAGQTAKHTEAIKVILSDGTTYTLNDSEGITAGEIHFGAQSAKQLDSKKTNRHNEIVTLDIPKGKTYAIVLADGTSVKINSASVLKFPLFFEGNTREVSLDGEAYFEVAKQRNKPFIVNTQEMNVKVLGTKFNVNTYPGNDAQTSLVEGSVAVSDHTAKTTLIKPGQAAIKRGAKPITVEAFSAEQVLSWLSGTYYFNNMPLREIVNITNRVTGEDLYITNSNIANYRFSGALETDKPIQVLLENIKSSSSAVQYSIKGGRIELY